MRSYEIRLTTPGFDGAVKNMDAMGRSMKRIDDRLNKIASSASGLDAVTRRMEKLADALDRVASGQAAITGNKQGVSGGGGRAGGGGRRSGFLSGPNQRLETIAQQMPQAVLQNNIPAIADLERAKRLAERSIALDSRRKNDPEHLSRPGLLELFSEMNGLLGKLSRGDVFGITGKIIQLGGGRNAAGGVNMQQMAAYGLPSAMKAQDAAAGGIMGRLAPLAGSAVRMAANPLVIGAAAGVGAIYALSHAAKSAAGVIGEMSAAASGGGSSLGQVAGLSSLGVGAGSQVSLGASLRNSLSSNPYAMAVGGYQMPGHLTGASDAPLIRQHVEMLHALYAEGRAMEAVRRARVFGTESLLKEAAVSDRVFKMRQKDSSAYERLYSQVKPSTNPDLEASRKRVGEGWQAIGERIIQNLHLREIETGWNNTLANIEQWMAKTTWVKTWGAPSPQSGGKTSPIDKNTAALEELAKVLKEVVGAGPRARGALSPGQKAAIQRGMDWDTARNLGAFRL